MTAEPSDQTWMYGLDLPMEGPGGVVYSEDFTLSAPAKITKRVRYSLASCLDCQNTVTGNLERLLALPDFGEKRRVSWPAHGRKTVPVPVGS